MLKRAVYDGMRSDAHLAGVGLEDHEPFVARGMPGLAMDLTIPGGQMSIPGAMNAEGAFVSATASGKFSLDKGALVDVNVTDPICAAHVGQAAVCSGSTASKAVKRKYDHYTGHFDPRNHILIPFVVESFGRLSVHAQRLIKAMAEHQSRRCEGARPAVDFVASWRQRVSIAVQRSVSDVVARSMSRTRPVAGQPAPDIRAYMHVRLLQRPVDIG